jgi:hypothetical protein
MGIVEAKAVQKMTGWMTLNSMVKILHTTEICQTLCTGSFSSDVLDELCDFETTPETRTK